MEGPKFQKEVTGEEASFCPRMKRALTPLPAQHLAEGMEQPCSTAFRRVI